MKKLKGNKSIVKDNHIESVFQTNTLVLSDNKSKNYTKISDADLENVLLSKESVDENHK
ncbi:MAG: hypothetical protein RSE93_01120 [Oscillospiraceae bacterium]